MQNFSYETNYRFEFNNSEYKLLNDEIKTCNLPGITLGTIEKRYEGKQINLPGKSLTIEDLTIVFNHDIEYNNWIKVFTWILDNYNGINMSSGTLYILDRKDIPIFSLSIGNLFPYNITEIQYSRTNNSPDPLTFSASFKLNDLSYNSNF